MLVPPLFKFLLHAAAANSASVKPEGLGIAKRTLEREPEEGELPFVRRRHPFPDPVGFFPTQVGAAAHL